MATMYSTTRPLLLETLWGDFLSIIKIMPPHSPQGQGFGCQDLGKGILGFGIVKTCIAANINFFEIKQDSLAEWSKALASGASP